MLTQQLTDQLERQVINPLKVQVNALQRWADKYGFDSAVEIATRRRTKPGDPHAGSTGLAHWCEDARANGVTNPTSIALSDPTLVELTDQLNVFRKGHNQEPEPVAVGGDWSTPNLWGEDNDNTHQN